MFEDCGNLTSIDLPNFDANPKNMYNLFKNTYSVEYINIPKLKTDFITNALSIFENCYSLKSLDLPSFTMTSVKNMKSTFSNCGNLTSLDLYKFDTEDTTDMSYMFNNCSSLTNLKINFNTQKVTNMEKMFFSCIKLTSLDLTSFDTTACYNFNNMFDNDIDLDLYIDKNKCSNLIAKLPEYVHPKYDE